MSHGQIFTFVMQIWELYPNKLGIVSYPLADPVGGGAYGQNLHKIQ